MNGINRLILICLVLWLATKFVLMNYVSLQTNVTTGVLLNLFFILLISVFAIRRKIKDTPKSASHFLDDLKAVVRAAAKYVIGAIIALGIFNYGIAKEVTQGRYEELKSEIHQQYQNESAYQELLASNPTLKNVPREEAMAKAIESLDLLSRWYIQLTLALMALMIAAILYSLLVTVLWRNLMT